MTPLQQAVIALKQRLNAARAKELSETYLCYHGGVYAKYSLLYAAELLLLESYFAEGAEA